jgi:hypothetical protein
VPKSQKVETCKLQLTVDLSTARLLQEMTALGVHGTTKAEVAVSLLRSWLWANEEKLRQNGVFLSPPAATQGQKS